ncbi:MAG: hypothetical protein ABL949_12320 [Fimbriimonadaceae bacterium]
MKKILLSFWFSCAIFASAVSFGQELQLKDAAQDTLRGLFLEYLWEPENIQLEIQTLSEPALPERGGTVGTVSSDKFELNFVFNGDVPKLMRFDWNDRKQKMAKRPNKTFRAEQSSYAAKAQNILSNLDIAPWEVTKWVDYQDPSVGGMQPFSDGAVGFWFERFHSNMPDRESNGHLFFDAEDGNVISLVCSRLERNYEEPGGEVGKERAKSFAYDNAVRYINAKFSENAREEFIRKMEEARQTWRATLCYGNVTDESTGPVDPKYRVKGLAPLQYSVDLGPITMMVHAKSGDHLGGIIPKSSVTPGMLGEKPKRTSAQTKTTNIAIPAVIGFTTLAAAFLLSRKLRRR